MQIVRSATALPGPGKKRGFVPTMGALHEGHATLMREARAECEEVVASIFVNPTQFAANEDFSRYPRHEERDTALAEEAGVDYLFVPSVDEMYPLGTGAVTVHVHGVTDRWEGESRPGHFDGVSLVVAKLFNMTRPNVAYFGQKDLQQVAVVRRMIKGLNFPIDLSVVPTVREADGLALSSRNVYLSQEERALAPRIYQTLVWARDQLRANEAPVEEVLDEAKNRLNSGFRLNYFTLIDAHTMEPLSGLSAQAALVVAAYCGNTRLIDNLLIFD